MSWQQFYYDAPVMGFISKVYPYPYDGPNPWGGGLMVDAVTNDLRSIAVCAPVFLMPGVTRNLRRGQGVMIFYPSGQAQHPVVIAHTFNNETDPSYADPMTAAFQNIDDFVIHHDETGAYIRFRNVNSSATEAGVDGSPCQFQVTFASGASLSVLEHNPPGYPVTPPPGTPPTPPPPPPRATFSYEGPSGELLQIDEPVVGKCTFEFNHPTGAQIAIDTLGNVTISAAPGQDITVNGEHVDINAAAQCVITSPDVEVGGLGGRTLAYKDELQTLTDTFNSHQHIDPQGGLVGTPTTSAPDPVGTQNTKAL